MTIVLPHVFRDNVGEPPSGVAVNENFNTVTAALEGVSLAAEGHDVYQPGVLASTDWVPALAAWDEPAKGVKMTGLGGAAWVHNPFGTGLMRIFNAPATVFAKPPLRPAPGGYMCVGVELQAATGSEAVTSTVSGTEQVSEAEALAHPPAVTAGKTRIWDYVIKNTAGSFSTVKERDRRPWARGASAFLKRVSGDLVFVGGGGAAILASGFALRVECSSAPVRLRLRGTLVSTGGGSDGFGFRMDGAAVDGTEDGQLTFFNPSAASNFPIAVDYEFGPAAGSHLFQPTIAEVAACHVKSTAQQPLLFSVEELRPSANNGTS